MHHGVTINNKSSVIQNLQKFSGFSIAQNMEVSLKIFFHLNGFNTFQAKNVKVFPKI